MARQKNDGRGRMGGRQKGTPNKATATMRKFISDFVSKNRRRMQQDLDALSPLERLQTLEKLMQYVIPKQTAQKVDADINNLGDEQLNAIIDEITGNLQDDGR